MAEVRKTHKFSIIYSSAKLTYICITLDHPNAWDHN